MKGGIGMYDKVFLDPVEAEMIYKEPVLFEKEGRITLKTARIFQEFLGAADFKEGRVSTKGHSIEVNLDFPCYVPSNKPLQNWFQVALFNEKDSILADPLRCSARYKGALPGILEIQQPVEFIIEGKIIENVQTPAIPEPYPATFIFCDDPRRAMVDYMLFVYDSADYQAFWEGVHDLLGGYLDRGQAVVSDSRGNKLLVSDDVKQPMLLIPISLVVGGLNYIYNAWDRLLGNII